MTRTGHVCPSRFKSSTSTNTRPSHSINGVSALHQFANNSTATLISCSHNNHMHVAYFWNVYHADCSLRDPTNKTTIFLHKNYVKTRESASSKIYKYMGYKQWRSNCFQRLLKMTCTSWLIFLNLSRQKGTPSQNAFDYSKNTAN